MMAFNNNSNKNLTNISLDAEIGKYDHDSSFLGITNVIRRPQDFTESIVTFERQPQRQLTSESENLIGKRAQDKNGKLQRDGCGKKISYNYKQSSKKRETSEALKEQLFGKISRKSCSPHSKKSVRFSVDGNSQIVGENIPLKCREPIGIHDEKKPAFYGKEEPARRRRVTEFWKRRDQRRMALIAQLEAKEFSDYHQILVEKLKEVVSHHTEYDQEQDFLQKWVESDGRGLETKLLRDENISLISPTEWARKIAIADAAVARRYFRE